MRGVTVGSVQSISPSLQKVSVSAKINSEAIRIPKNALIEANQSGLISESLVDITPRKPIPTEEQQVCGSIM